MMENPTVVYFHVGLGKTASTWLQQEVFPRLNGIRFIPPQKYRQSKAIIQKHRGGRLLVSREFDRQFEREVKWFTDSYPDAQVIVVFRKHAEWIASQYKRHVKNGWSGDLEQFLDLSSSNQGFWNQEDLLYSPKLEIIEKYCRKKPLVLLYEDLKTDPERFLQQITTYTKSILSQNKIRMERIHTSFSDTQLLVLRDFCRKYMARVPTGYRSRWKHWLLYRPWWVLFHLILYSAKALPEGLVPNEPLIDPAYLKKIQRAYEADWQQVVAYAAKK